MKILQKINFLTEITQRKPKAPTNEILDNCLLHKTKPFEYQKNSDEGKYKQVQHSQYIIKIYNKALHYKSKGFKIKDEIMRFEIKYTKTEKFTQFFPYPETTSISLSALRFN